MLSFFFMFCAAGNAWAADRNFKKGNLAYGLLCAALSAISLLLWTREVQL